jgi:DNA invertase Pin-like site-specific DNA recombinase
VTREEAVKGIRRAAGKRGRANRARRKAIDELQGYCREAKAAGVPISQIAREAGLSRQGVYDLLAHL